MDQIVKDLKTVVLEIQYVAVATYFFDFELDVVLLGDQARKLSRLNPHTPAWRMTWT